MDKRIWAVFCALAAILAMAVITPFSAAQDRPASPDADKTLSPYFHVKSDDPETDRLPLKSTEAQVKIAGVIADVTLTQVYKNEGKNVLEAVYVFPGSTRAAVYAMRMTVGDRIIEADIMERNKARQTYEQAKKDGKTASLLEQQRPNVFQMNVANILPGDTIKVEMKYTELIEPEDQTYEFVFPAVVGPRYSETPEAGAPDTESWVKNPYLHEGEGAPYAFDLTVDLKTGIPISGLTSPGTEINVQYDDPARAHVTLQNKQKAALKDFVLRYKLAGDKIETGLLLYPGKDENFFLMMMEPPKQVTPEVVLPREYIFIVDVSGSMNGFPLTDVAKPMMSQMINALGPRDYMNVLLFAGGSSVLSPSGSLQATPNNIRQAVSWLNQRQAGGGTRILPALEKALALPQKEGISRTIVVVTDGYVSVEAQVFELIRKNLGKANLFAFGVGSSVNRHLIEGMARVGMGAPFVALNRSEGERMAYRFRKYVENPVLTDIQVRFSGFKAYDVEPISVPDMFGSRPIVVFGKYNGGASGKIVVDGQTAAGAFHREMSLQDGVRSQDNAALRLLWARHRIMRISDLHRLAPSDRGAKEVTELGLKYNLMTQFTSFVAVDKVKRADGSLVTVKQPLPLPEGVTDMAVGRGGSRYMASPAPYPLRMKSKMESAGGLVNSFAGTKAQPGLPATAPTYAAADSSKEAESKPVQANGRGVHISVEEIRGGLEKTMVESALRAKIKLLEDCYRKATSQRNKSVEGEITFRLTIAPDGRVTGVKVESTTIADVPTEKCFQTALQTVKFSAPAKSAVVIVKLTCGK